MAAHKFGVGAHVQYRSSFRHQSVGTGHFTVTGHMPPDGEGNQYRIENRADRHQRVVHEAELSKAPFLT